VGRYYNGDISGKFWFGIQGSDAGERFGCVEEDPGYVCYFTDDLEQCQLELKSIEAELGDKIALIEEILKHGHNSKSLKDSGISESDLEDYADWELGKKIEACLLKNGTCRFEADIS
jgi:hypothetical protein